MCTFVGILTMDLPTTEERQCLGEGVVMTKKLRENVKP